MTDFFTSSYGDKKRYRWSVRRFGLITDRLYDTCLNFNRFYQTLAHKSVHLPSRRVLIVGVDVPARASDLRSVMAQAERSYHMVTRRIAPLLKGAGKFQNINAALHGVDFKDYDWVIILDDDIKLPEGFLDRFIYLAEHSGLQLCQPANKISLLSILQYHKTSLE